MRSGPLRRLSAALLVGLLTLASFGGRPRADDPLQITLEPPERLVEGSRSAIGAVVHVASDVPVIITPNEEGTALFVVRGRLFRADAEDPSASPLRFRIPIVARQPGTAVVRVRASSFECEGDDCRAVQGEASLTLRVEPRPPE